MGKMSWKITASQKQLQEAWKKFFEERSEKEKKEKKPEKKNEEGAV